MTSSVNRTCGETNHLFPLPSPQKKKQELNASACRGADPSLAANPDRWSGRSNACFLLWWAQPDQSASFLDERISCFFTRTCPSHFSTRKCPWRAGFLSKHMPARRVLPPVGVGGWRPGPHGVGHGAVMALPLYTGIRQGEVHVLGPGVRNGSHRVRSGPMSDTSKSIERACEATSTAETPRWVSRETCERGAPPACCALALPPVECREPLRELCVQTT